MAIVFDFFLSNKTAMLYICETGDEKQAMRDRLFRFWAATSSKYANFSIWTESVEDEEGVINFATLVLRKDHSKCREVMEEFISTVDLLNNKPQS